MARAPSSLDPSSESPRLPKPLDDQELRNLILGTFGQARWTQDSPIVPDVWIGYIKIAEDVARKRIRGFKPGTKDSLDLLITPWTGASPGEIARRVRSEISPENLAKARVATSSTRVVAEIDFQTLVQALIPLTGWWQGFAARSKAFEKFRAFSSSIPEDMPLANFLVEMGPALELLRYAVLVGFIVSMQNAKSGTEVSTLNRIARRMAHSSDPGAEQTSAMSRPTPRDVNVLLSGFHSIAGARLMAPDAAAGFDTSTASESVRIWLVNLNRPAMQTMFDSRKTVKADAAQRVFDTAGRGIAFAIVDDGIDARHAGFLKRSDRRVADRLASANPGFDTSELKWSSRIQATYDFSRLRNLLAESAQGVAPQTQPVQRSADSVSPQALSTAVSHLQVRAESGRGTDWAIIAPLIRVPHDANYQPPAADHGTHVAGILAANLPEPEDLTEPLQGVCTDITLYDLRVFAADGSGDEFAILSAIEFVGWLNRDRENPVIHGVNLSLALRHDVDSFGCGRTPVCDACNQLVGAGTVVVVAAGNTGFDGTTKQSLGNGYRTVSITDPGNAEEVITVGSTHRRDPHAYGVSYFSSRGPTGDGRRKPDIIAPGEKITSTIRDNRTQRLDGTSMAAPHVSGAAALLMARYPELIGHPRKIKQILMQTATDLGRDVSFQGAGLVDVLRALQAV